VEAGNTERVECIEGPKGADDTEGGMPVYATSSPIGGLAFAALKSSGGTEVRLSGVTEGAVLLVEVEEPMADAVVGV